MPITALGVVGPPGPKGDKGDPGSQGVQGPPWDPALLLTSDGQIAVNRGGTVQAQALSAAPEITAKADKTYVDTQDATKADAAATTAALAGKASTASVAAITPANAPFVGGQQRKAFDGMLKWLRGPHVNLADVLTAGSSDHTAELRGVIEGNGPGYTYHLPAGMPVNLPLGNVPASAVRLRNQVYIEGEGPQSVINVTGYGANPGGTYYSIGIDWNVQAEDIDGAGIRNLTIQGDGPGATQTWTNRQASAVRVLGSNKRIDNLVFADVVFRNHDGFPLHADGDDISRHAVIERCQFINNGNGLNCNTPFATVRHCFFTNSEGIENSGAGSVIDGNILLNVFATGISIGGNQSSGANMRVYPGSRVVNNWISGVLGGTGFGTGHGIIQAQSDTDVLIANNYIERVYGSGIVTTHDSSGNLADDQGHTILGNHLVNCGNSGTGGGSIALLIATANTRIIGNRAYNRTAYTADIYPLGTYRMLSALSLTAANCLIDGNDFDVNTIGNWTVTLGAGATNTRWGTNRVVAGTNGAIQLSGGSFADASRVATNFASGANFVNPVFTDRWFTLIAPGTNRAHTLHTAAGCPGKQITFVNTDATFTWTITPNGTEKINGVNAAKVLGPGYSSITLTSDGSNWLMTNVVGTVS